MFVLYLRILNEGGVAKLWVQGLFARVVCRELRGKGGG